MGEENHPWRVTAFSFSRDHAKAGNVNKPEVPRSALPVLRSCRCPRLLKEPAIVPARGEWKEVGERIG